MTVHGRNPAPALSPAVAAMMSPHVAAGEISPGDLWRAMKALVGPAKPTSRLAGACRAVLASLSAREWSK